MHRIDTPTAQKDKFGAGKNGFTKGNPQTGTPATEIDETILDAVQEEICSVIEGEGIQLNKNESGQLYKAIKKIIVNLDLKSASKRDIGTGQNQIPDMSAWTSGLGWNRDPSGKITQRGFSPTSSQTSILFPIPFPHDDFEVIVCASDAAANKGAVNVLRKSRQGFDISQVGISPVAYRWFAG